MNHKLQLGRTCLTWLLIATPTFGQPLPNTSSLLPEGQTDAFLTVRVNGSDAYPNVRVMRRDQDVLVSTADLKSWGFDLGTIVGEQLAEHVYVSLGDLPGVSFTVNEGRQELMLSAVAGVFVSRTLSGRTLQTKPPQHSSPGGFLNYDLTALFGPGGERLSSGVFEAGGFYRDWAATSTFALGEDGGLRRLDTAWTRDLPRSMAGWKVGDAVSSAGLLGRPVRFAGVQFATDFTIRPDFVMFPLPTVVGEAALPSVVDLYIDGALRWSGDVPTGPFELDDPPLLDGAGQLELRIRDLAGREQRISKPFYVSTELLSPGLVEHSYELGWLRSGFGGDADQYGQLMASGKYRRGLTSQLTAEVYGQIVEDGRGSLGISSFWRAGNIGVLTLGAYGNEGPSGSGFATTLGFEHRGRLFSFSVESVESHGDFKQLGVAPERELRSLLRAQVGLSPRGLGNLNLNYLERQLVDGSAVELLSASYSKSLWRRWLFAASALKSGGADGDLRLTTSLTVTVGRRTVAGARFRRSSSNASRSSMRWQRSTPRNRGVGYRVTADLGEDGDSDRFLAAADVVRPSGRYSLEVGHSNGETGVRLNAVGALTWLRGLMMPSQRVTQSFAHVHVGGYQGVRIYADNQLVGRSNDRGVAVIPYLRPYQDNPIKIDGRDLPLSARIDSQLEHAIPYNRGGLLLDFPVRSPRGMIVQVVLENGEVPPAGSRAQLNSSGQSLLVGSQGSVYVEDAAPTDQLVFDLPDGRCRAQLGPPPKGALPTLGPIMCQPMENQP